MFDPITQAEDEFIRRDSDYQEQSRQAEKNARLDFLELCRKGNAYAKAEFADLITTSINDTKRRPTCAEIMVESLDYKNGPSFDDVMQFVLNASKKGNFEATELITRMSEVWAFHNAKTW